jgi:hypothetical protein
VPEFVLTGTGELLLGAAFAAGSLGLRGCSPIRHKWSGRFTGASL